MEEKSVTETAEDEPCNDHGNEIHHMLRTSRSRFLLASAAIESVSHMVHAAGRPDVLLLVLSYIFFFAALPWERPRARKFAPGVLALIILGPALFIIGIFEDSPLFLKAGFFLLLVSLLTLHAGRSAVGLTLAEHKFFLKLSIVLAFAGTIAGGVLLSGAVGDMGQVFDDAVESDWSYDDVESEFASHGMEVGIVSGFYLAAAFSFCIGFVQEDRLREDPVVSRVLDIWKRFKKG